MSFASARQMINASLNSYADHRHGRFANNSIAYVSKSDRQRARSHHDQVRRFVNHSDRQVGLFEIER